MRLVVLLLLSATVSMASECVEVSQRQAFRRATVVFKGTVIKIEEVSEQETHPEDKVQTLRSAPGDPRMVTLAATVFWKGRASKLVRVFLFLHPSEGTGYRFKLDSEYIVYTLGLANGWRPLDRLSEGEPVYEIGGCVLRVRPDVKAESMLLGRGRSAP